jgi:hypothetical protein
VTVLCPTVLSRRQPWELDVEPLSGSPGPEDVGRAALRIGAEDRRGKVSRLHYEDEARRILPGPPTMQFISPTASSRRR